MPVVRKRMGTSGRQLHLARLSQQICHLEFTGVRQKLFTWREKWVLAQIRMAVFEHQSDQDFADDTAADRPQTNRSVVLLELLLSLRQHIEPKRRVARKIRRDVRDALVGGRVVF